MFKHRQCRDGRRFARRNFDDDGRPRHGGPRHGWGEHDGRHGRRGGGRGEGRVLDQGDLRFVLLWLIAERPRSGYELIKAMEELSGGAYSPSPGAVYPTLTLLREIGHIDIVAEDGAKKSFGATPDGIEALAANTATVDLIRERLAMVKARHGGERPPQVVRAVENLKLALSLRLSRGDLTAEGIDAIATAIDEAARAVERA